jgi:hypothetical protein
MLASNQPYSSGPARNFQAGEPDWSACLPAAWRAMAEAPLHIVEHREYEMAASRWLGYDADERLCYYAHHYLIEACRSDDDEEFYLAVAGGETLQAWRLRDERWLIYRQPVADDHPSPKRGFYSFSMEAPR